MQAILLLFSLACVAAASIVGDPRKLTSASAAAVPSAADSMTGAVKGVQVGYTLSGSGWSSCKLSVQGIEPVTLTASYLTDALKSLLKGTHSVVSREATEGWVWFAEEPGQYIIRLNVLPGDSGTGPTGATNGDWPMRLRASFNVDDDGWAERKEEGPILKLDAVVGLKAFGRAVSSTAHALLDKHGVKGYNEEWVEHDFPLDELTALDAALSRLQEFGQTQ